MNETHAKIIAQALQAISNQHHAPSVDEIGNEISQVLDEQDTQFHTSGTTITPRLTDEFITEALESADQSKGEPLSTHTQLQDEFEYAIRTAAALGRDAGRGIGADTLSLSISELIEQAHVKLEQSLLQIEEQIRETHTTGMNTQWGLIELDALNPEDAFYITDDLDDRTLQSYRDEEEEYEENEQVRFVTRMCTPWVEVPSDER